MSKKNIIILTVGLVTFTVFFGWLRSNIRLIPGLHNASPILVQAIVLTLGILGASIFAWFSVKKQKAGKDESPEDSQDIDDLIYEAESRLSEAQNQKDSKISALPAVFLVGAAGSAKTSTVVNSGLDPELLSGQVYEESKIAPTPTANIWFTRHTLLIETAGKLIGDTATWRKLIDATNPGKLASMLGTVTDQPRAALVCFDAEQLGNPDSEALNAGARNIRTRLSEIAQLLGINLPVYVVFTRTDRVPFFAEYVRNLNNDEAVKTIGATVPILTARTGVYSEEETTRLTSAFEALFRGLCNGRPEFLSREGDTAMLPGIYEFPREFRKLRGPVVRFLVELCRPSQLTEGPFLRGFYFSGVRPVVVNEVAGGIAPQEARGSDAGVTGFFRAGQRAPQAPQRIIGTKKVPQWLFLGSLFNDILLGDQPAQGANRSGVKANVPRRIALGVAALLCLGYCGLLANSFRGNRAMESKVSEAASGIAPADPASLDSLQHLETLRQTVVDDCQNVPFSQRFGLYVGHAVCPEAQRLYTYNFERLLLNPVRSVMLEWMRALPPTPGPGFEPSYNTLKAYLITTCNHEKTDNTLSPTLLDRWSAGRGIDKPRIDLAKLQFDFYADQLKQDKRIEDNDVPAVEKTRAYLANNFENLDVKYQQLLAGAAKAGSPVRFDDPAKIVTDPREVSAAFSKEGWNFVRNALKNPAQYDKSDWVLGNRQFTKASESGGQQSLAAILAARYYGDFSKQWLAYLSASNVARYSTLADAAGKLDTLTANNSALVSLLWLASKNTAVDRPETASVFVPVQTVVPGTGGPSVATPNDAYIDKLSGLKKSVKALADNPQGDIKDVLQNASDAEDAVKKITRYNADPAGNPAQTEAAKEVDRFLRLPITWAVNLVKTLGPGELNQKGKAACQPYRVLTSKFPFTSNPSAPPATVAEVNGIFKKPDGALWKLYNENLQKLMPLQGAQYVAAAGSPVTPAFVAFFNRWAAISDFLYPANAQNPQFKYTVKIAQLDRMNNATLDLQIDGQQLSYSGTASAPKQFSWQADASHEVKATANLGGTPLSWGSSRNKGLWSLFDFLSEGKQPANGNPNWYGWNLGITGSRGASRSLDESAPAIWLEVDFGNPVGVVRRGSFALPGCVAEVAK